MEPCLTETLACVPDKQELEQPRFDYFLDAVMTRSTWGPVWPPVDLVQAAAHVAHALGLTVTLKFLGHGQYTSVVHVETETYTVAVKFVRPVSGDVDSELLTHEFMSEARTLMEMERRKLELQAVRHVGQFYASALLGPHVPVLVLESYDNYAQFSHLFTLPRTPVWLECVRQALFQVLFALAELQYAYTDFRHNDLKDSNVLCVVLDPPTCTGKDRGPWNYTLQDACFELNPAYVDVKLIDFSHAHANTPALWNEAVANDTYIEFDVSDVACPLYDVHLLWVCIRARCAPGDTQLRAFLDDVLPPRYFTGPAINENRRLSMAGQASMVLDPELAYPTPADVLRHPFFDSLRQQLSDMHVDL
jgi:hypothetical protein